MKAGLIDRERVVVDGLSGTSGAGAEPVTPTHHSEIGNGVFPYNVVEHRHTYEIEQELSGVAGAPVTVHFTPYYCPFTRGILAGCHGFLTRAVTRADVLKLYEEFYRDEPFVRPLAFEKDPKASWQYLPYPSVASVAGSNFVQIGVRRRTPRAGGRLRRPRQPRQGRRLLGHPEHELHARPARGQRPARHGAAPVSGAASAQVFRLRGVGTGPQLARTGGRSSAGAG
ncbi:MAG: Asd/ArgC dimerization domain-containing protein [Candidatus Binatia bacterium]